MLFQTLDDKSECVGIYCDGQLLFDPSNFPQGISKTWKYSSYLRDIKNVEYANLYLQGRDIQEVIPEYLRDDWEDASAKIRAFHRSLEVSKVDQFENCFFDLVPKRFLLEYCDVKNKITEHVFKTYPRPGNYDFLLSLTKTLEDIKSRKLKTNIRCLDKQLSSPRTRQFIKKLSKNNT